MWHVKSKLGFLQYCVSVSLSVEAFGINFIFELYGDTRHAQKLYNEKGGYIVIRWRMTGGRGWGPRRLLGLLYG